MTQSITLEQAKSQVKTLPYKALVNFCNARKDCKSELAKFARSLMDEYTNK